MTAGSEACGGPVQDAPRPGTTRRAQQDPQRPAEKAQHDGLDEKLPQDVVRPGPDGHPQADFPRSLGDRNQHDVHDAHAAHRQRDRRHDQQQRLIRREAEARARVISVMSWMLKSSGLAGAHVVPFPQQRLDLLHGLGDLSAEAALMIDLAHVGEADRLRRVGDLHRRRRSDKAPRRPGRAGSAVDLLRCRRQHDALWFMLVDGCRPTRNLMVVQGAEQDVVLVGAHHVGPFAAQYADHPQARVLDANLLAPAATRPGTARARTVSPMTHTLAALWTSLIGEHFDPSSRSSQSRMARYEGVVPVSAWGTQLRLP